MRLPSFLAQIVSIVFLFTWAFPSMAQDNLIDHKTISIITFEYPPYMNEHGTGMAEEIVRLAFQHKGYSVTFIHYPNKRARRLYRDSETVFFLGTKNYFKDIEIKEHIESITLFNMRRILLYLKEQQPSFSFTTIDELKGKIIGSTPGSSHSAKFRQAGLIVEETTIENNIKKLFRSRIDFVQTLDISATQLIHELYPDIHHKFDYAELSIQPCELVIKNTNKRSQQIFNDFKNGFNSIIESGLYTSTLEQYYGPGQVPPSVPAERLSIHQ